MIFIIKNQIRSDFHHKKFEKKSSSQKYEKKREKFSLMHEKIEKKGSSVDLYCRDLMRGSKKKKRGSSYSLSSL